MEFQEIGLGAGQEGDAVAAGDGFTDFRHPVLGAHLVTGTVEAPVLPAEAKTCSRIGAIADPGGVLVGTARRQLDTDGDTSILRLVAFGLHLHAREIVAVLQAALQVQQLAGAVFGAGLEPYIGLQQLLPEVATLEAHRPQFVAHPRFQHQHDSRAVAVHVHFQAMGTVTGIEVAQAQGLLQQTATRLFIAAVQQGLSATQGQGIQGRLQARIRLAFAAQPDIHLFQFHPGAGIDHIAGQPAISLLAQLRPYANLVMTKGLQGGLDLLLRPPMQAAYAQGCKSLLLALPLHAQQGAHVIQPLSFHALDLDAQGRLLRQHEHRQQAECYQPCPAPPARYQLHIREYK